MKPKLALRCYSIKGNARDGMKLEACTFFKQVTAEQFRMWTATCAPDAWSVMGAVIVVVVVVVVEA